MCPTLFKELRSDLLHWLALIWISAIGLWLAANYPNYFSYFVVTKNLSAIRWKELRNYFQLFFPSWIYLVLNLSHKKVFCLLCVLVSQCIFNLILLILENIFIFKNSKPEWFSIFSPLTENTASTPYIRKVLSAGQFCREPIPLTTFTRSLTKLPYLLSPTGLVCIDWLMLTDMLTLIGAFKRVAGHWLATAKSTLIGEQNLKIIPRMFVSLSPHPHSASFLEYYFSQLGFYLY